MRAVFSSQDGGRWIEFTWKDANLNFLPDQGFLTGAGPAEARAAEDGVEFSGPGWSRKVKLSENTLTIEQNAPLPPGGPAAQKRGSVTLTVDRPSPNRAVYTVR